MNRTTTSELTLITGMGRVPMTRSQIATWRRRVETAPYRELRSANR